METDKQVDLPQRTGPTFPCDS